MFGLALYPDQLELSDFPDWATQSKAHDYFVCAFYVRAMFGPCWDHVWPGITSIPAIVLKSPWLALLALQDLSNESLLIRSLLGPCFDHVGTIFGQGSVPYQLELLNFQDWVNNSISAFAKGHGCSFHLQNQEKEQQIGTWMYQRPVTISKTWSRWQTLVGNLQQLPKPQIRT